MKTSGLRAPFLAVCLGFLFFGCAGKPSRDEANGATSYIGPDGRVVVAHAGGNRPARKSSAKRPAWTLTWAGDGVAGAPSIVISLGEQVAVFYKGGDEVGRAPVSTGREGFSTPSGQFSISERNASHVSNLYGDYVSGDGEVVVRGVSVDRDKRPPGTHFRGAPMPFFMRVTGAVGMHGGDLPGYPASHGCIRLPHDAAKVFFANAPAGTPVTIAP